MLVVEKSDTHEHTSTSTYTQMHTQAQTHTIRQTKKHKGMDIPPWKLLYV